MGLPNCMVCHYHVVDDNMGQSISVPRDQLVVGRDANRRHRRRLPGSTLLWTTIDLCSRLGKPQSRWSDQPSRYAGIFAKDVSPVSEWAVNGSSIDRTFSSSRSQHENDPVSSPEWVRLERFVRWTR